MPSDRKHLENSLVMQVALIVLLTVALLLVSAFLAYHPVPSSQGCQAMKATIGACFTRGWQSGEMDRAQLRLNQNMLRKLCIPCRWPL